MQHNSSNWRSKMHRNVSPFLNEMKVFVSACKVEEIEKNDNKEVVTVTAVSYTK